MSDSTRSEFTVRPVPDPTALTTQQLWREITAVREIVETRVAALERHLDTADRQNQLSINTKIDAVAIHVDIADKQIEDLAQEKFRSIQVQFTENKDAISAALASAEKAVSKSELSFTKQIDQLMALVNTVQHGLDAKLNEIKKALDDKVDDLRLRITAIESVKRGGESTWGWIIAGVGLLVAIASVVVSVMIRFSMPR